MQQLSQWKLSTEFDRLNFGVKLTALSFFALRISRLKWCSLPFVKQLRSVQMLIITCEDFSQSKALRYFIKIPKLLVLQQRKVFQCFFLLFFLKYEITVISILLDNTVSNNRNIKKNSTYIHSNILELYLGNIYLPF